MVGGNTFVRSAVVLLDAGYHQPSICCGHCCGRQAGPAQPSPGEADGMGAVGEALHNQRFSGLEPHLVRQAGGIRRGCKDKKNFMEEGTQKMIPILAKTC